MILDEPFERAKNSTSASFSASGSRVSCGGEFRRAHSCQVAPEEEAGDEQQRQDNEDDRSDDRDKEGSGIHKLVSVSLWVAMGGLDFSKRGGFLLRQALAVHLSASSVWLFSLFAFAITRGPVGCGET